MGVETRLLSLFLSLWKPVYEVNVSSKMHFAYSDLGTWYSCQSLLFLGISKSSSVLKYISKFCCGQVLRWIKLEGLFGNTTLLRDEESYCCLTFFFNFICMCALSACMLRVPYTCLVPAEVRRGHQIHWK